MHSSGLSADDAQDRDHWRLRVKGKVADPGLHGKWLLVVCMYMHAVI